MAPDVTGSIGAFQVFKIIEGPHITGDPPTHKDINMAKDTKAFNAQLKMMELNNQSTYFDLETNRLEQKCRVKDAFPGVNNLIKLNLRSAVIQKRYYKDNANNFHSELITAIRSMKMEFSISIEGLGRQEFIKMFMSKTEEEEKEEGKKDILQQMADAIG